MEEYLCSVALKLKLKQCSPNSSEKQLSTLAESEKELFELRSGLKVDDVTNICGFHMKHFSLDDPNFFRGSSVSKGYCYNPISLHNNKRYKGGF